MGLNYLLNREKDPNVNICFFTATAIFTKQYAASVLKLDKNIDKDFFIQKPIISEDLLKRITLIMNKN
jgi:hypothetical protein